MGQDHIGIREGRRGGSHWDLRVPQDLHLNGYRALTLFEDLFAAGILSHACRYAQSSVTNILVSGGKEKSFMMPNLVG